jgi:hypothetical protein
MILSRGKIVLSFFDIWQFYTTFASSYLHTAIEAFDCLLVIEKRKDEKIQ